jgi:TPP-dependent pyruvate/acetoin dehydrogenase alpha subunit
MTKDELISFEEGIAEEFNAGKIRYPIHLDSGNENALIDIFKSVNPLDWVFGSWRLHYKALLKGVPPEELHAAIHRGESMALRFDQYRVYGSAIVGGTIPIALGTAFSIKRRGVNEHVWLFVGDMAAESGILHETIKYAENFDLPLTVVIEDNGVSVCTDTKETWGATSSEFGTLNVDVIRYKYQSKYPHAGAGKRIQF